MERTLYEPVMHLFNAPHRFVTSDRKGLSAFGVELDGIKRKVDIAAFEWSGDYDVNTVAVECKIGGDWVGPSKAIDQATAYQVLFQKTYIASTTMEADLGHLKPILKKIGVGYIHVDEKCARMVFPANRAPWFNQQSSKLQVRRKAMLALAFQEIYGKERIRVGRADRHGEIWVSNNKEKSCNLLIHLYPRNRDAKILEDELHIGFNIEKKRIVERAFRVVDLEDLYKSLSELPSNYFLLLWDASRRGHDKLCCKYQANQVSLTELQTLTGKIRRMDYKVNLQVIAITSAKDLDNMSREGVTRLVKEVDVHLRPIFNLVPRPLWETSVK